MFDKLIVSEPEGADIKNRRNYFMVSSFVVGVLFLAAVVFSIYATDFGLGKENFELSMLMAPPEIATADPKPLQPRSAAHPSQPQNLSPVKPTFVAPLDDSRTTPTTISTTPNISPVWSERLPQLESDTGNPGGIGRDATGTGPGLGGTGNSTEPTEPEPVIEPPPVIKPVEPKPPLVKSLGVITGRATYLPKPAYPAHAVALNLQGKVDVQVMIDESGKVVSANAVSGHKLLRAAAVNAAWNAKFDPTYLSKVPVKVTGVIVYNFSR